MDTLVSIPESVRGKVAIVQRRGVEIKDASTTAISRVYDDARYVWAVSDHQLAGRLWSVGLLVISNVLLTISMTTWSASVLCGDRVGQPARA
jgi:hypothetical protein